jgi:hypothetical protein
MEQALELRSRIERRAQERFNLSAGPLIRGLLLRLGQREHVLLLTMHHIVSDGWSWGVIARELAQLYGWHQQGRGNELPALPIQYADYAAWQQRWLSAEVLTEQLRYWSEHLHGAPVLLDLPTDRQRPGVQSYRGASVGVRLSSELTDGLRRLAQRHDVTLHMVLFAGFAALLARLSGQQDIVIGTPVANRPRAELEDLVGLFVNTLPLRVAVLAEQSVSELLAAVREATLAGYAHQDVPFEQVVETVQPPRSMSHSPVFQVMLALQNTPRSELELPGLTLSGEQIHVESAKVDLAAICSSGRRLLAGSSAGAACCRGWWRIRTRRSDSCACWVRDSVGSCSRTSMRR